MAKLRWILAAFGCVALASCDGGSPPGQIGGSDLVGAEGFEDAAIGDEGAQSDLAWQEGWVCRPAETKCMGSIFLSCNADGSDWNSLQCPADHKCTTFGCVLTGGDVPVQEETVVGDDTVVTPDDTTVPDMQPEVPPADLPKEETTVPPDVPDVQEVPQDVVGPSTCGSNPACTDGQVCCMRQGGLQCVPPNQCNNPDACASPTDCPSNEQCCPPQYGPPGAPGHCAATCGGGGLPATCGSDQDCTNGQTCVSAMGYGLCVSECGSDADCGGKTCQNIYVAKVCSCDADGDCGGLTCCEIPYVGLKTCLTQCISL
jgi:hypothetical protein